MAAVRKRDPTLDALRLTAAFRPGDYALRAWASGYMQVYAVRLGVVVDLAHMPAVVRNQRNVTRPVAALLGLPLYRWGFIPRSDMDLIQRLVAAVPVIDAIGLACVYRLYVYYALPGLPNYEIDALGRVRTYDLMKV